MDQGTGRRSVKTLQDHIRQEELSSTLRGNDVPRRTMDEVSSPNRLDLPFVTASPLGRLFRLVLDSHDERAWCRFRRRSTRPVSDIDTAVVVVGLKALDPEWPIREAIGAIAVGATVAVDGASRICP
jgi:hypothetical protein